jgi:UDP-GlcNAc:undecaprenyl-phosphate/decaprenyl-phosphate GlcNAc-1-phosphate transferase
MQQSGNEDNRQAVAPGSGMGGISFGRILLLLSFFLLIAAMLLWSPLEAVRTFIIIFVSSVCTVLVVTPTTMALAARAGAIDYPGGRHIHQAPTPRWGGIPVTAGVFVALLLTSIHYMPNLRAMLLGSFLVLVAGVLDDWRRISAGTKLFVQLAACAILIMDDVHVTLLGSTWWGHIGDWIITIVWTVGITNAVNFLDGMDGLVSGLVVGTSAIFFVLALLLGSSMLAYCSLALFGASLAFLSFNVKPARVFLGDGGSNFLGFFLATLGFYGGWAKNDPIVSLFIPILLLSVPIYDMIYTTVARIATGKVTSFRSWLEFTGTDHIHHRLEALGLTRGQVVVAICFLNMGIGLGAITLFEARTYGGVALIFQAVCVYTILALFETLGVKRKNAMPQKE